MNLSVNKVNIIKNIEIENQEPPVWFESYNPRPNNIPIVRKTIRRDNRLKIVSNLPAISAPNMRSLAPKIKNFILDFKMRGLGLALCSETWGKDDNKLYQTKIKRMLEIEGIATISTNRKYRRGGGTMIASDNKLFSLEKLPVEIPYNLEISWGLLRPKHGPKKEIIVVCFYYPPKCRKKTKMNDHIIENIHSLLTNYPLAEVIIGGDRNEFSVSEIISAVSQLKNVQFQPTLNGKNLDVILTTMSSLYLVPQIVSPVDCDDQSKGVPADHQVPIIYPVTADTLEEVNKYKTKTFRPLPESGRSKFKAEMAKVDWEHIVEGDSTTEQETSLKDKLLELLEKFLPTKTVKLRRQDLPWITKEIKSIDRQRQIEYTKSGKSKKFLKLNENFETKFKKSAEDFLKTNIRDLTEANPGKVAHILKNMGAKPGDNIEDGTFTLLGHSQLTNKQSADKIAQFFADISQKYPEINLVDLPERVKQRLQEAKNDPSIPIIDETLVENNIKWAKNTKGGVTEDLPTKIFKQIGPEIAKPVSILYNNIIETGEWPKRWKIEEAIPLSKNGPNPKDENEVRLISLTTLSSKTFEKNYYGMGSTLHWGPNRLGSVWGSKWYVCSTLPDRVYHIHTLQSRLQRTARCACVHGGLP